jgi:cephalosporin hydroxylase
MERLSKVYVSEYLDAMKVRHPNEPLAAEMNKMYADFYDGDPCRYRKPTERPMFGGMGWTLSSLGSRSTVSSTYRGLMNHKTPYDLVIYAALIWELKPRTILEFGSLQGGSGLWFADHLDSMHGAGEVHSFDIFDDCVSHRATHPRLNFHHADIRNVDTIDQALLQGLPHPWLVVDDAHVNPIKLMLLINSFLDNGDYYVKEDIDLVCNISQAVDGLRSYEAAGFMVDTLYADAFGLNVTGSPNGWFVKM